MRGKDSSYEEKGPEKVGGERRSLVVCVAWVMKKVSFVFDTTES